MTTPFSAFVPEVSQEVIGPPNMSIINAIRNTIADFCDATHCYQISTGQLAVTTSVPTYAASTFGMPADTELSAIKFAWFNSQQILPKSADQLMVIYAGSDWEDQTTVTDGAPQYITQLDRLAVRLIPAPDAQNAVFTLKLRLALRPTRLATTTTDEIYNSWLTEIAEGAKAYLMAQKGKPWYNKDRAAECNAQFELAKVKARIDQSRAMGYAPMRATAPKFCGK